MAALSTDAVEPVLLFCDTFSHPENEVRHFMSYSISFFLRHRCQSSFGPFLYIPMLSPSGDAFGPG